MNRRLLTGCLLLTWSLVACTGAPKPDAGNGGSPASSAPAAVKDPAAITFSAIPNQDPEKLKTLYTKLATYLEGKLKKPVIYRPMPDTTAAVTAFQSGDVDLVWLNGLAGVQARLSVKDAEAIAQRRTDRGLSSVFIANKTSKIAPFREQAGLKALKGHTFTFGPEDSTSDRLLPQYFLSQAGIKLSDFKGTARFAPDADAILSQVQAGTNEAGVVSAQVWDSRVQRGKVDITKVVLLWQTPEYSDYHWVIHPNVGDRFGKDFITQVENALLDLSPYVPAQKEILDGFGTEGFVRTSAKNYQELEKIGRELGKVPK
jgi:phosphonate transport system substrate-binding protein